MSDHTTPKECQKVAEKLREAGRELDGDSTSSIRSAFCAIYHIIGTQDTGRTFEPLFDRLADLIDPTCHMEPNYVSPFSDPQWFTCDKCGNDTEQLENYCPYCGARVVSEDA